MGDVISFDFRAAAQAKDFRSEFTKWFSEALAAKFQEYGLKNDDIVELVTKKCLDDIEEFDAKLTLQYDHSVTVTAPEGCEQAIRSAVEAAGQRCSEQVSAKLSELNIEGKRLIAAATYGAAAITAAFLMNR